MTFRLKKEYFDSEETLSISFIIFARSILAMKTQHRFEDILGRNSFVPEVPFFLEKIEAMDSSESFFNRRTSAKRKWQCCFLSRGLEDKEHRKKKYRIPVHRKISPWIPRGSSNHKHHLVTINLARWRKTLSTFFFYENRLRNLDDEEKSTAVMRNEEDDT